MFLNVVISVFYGDDAEGCEKVFANGGFVFWETSFNGVFTSTLCFCLLSVFEIFLCVLMSVTRALPSSHFWVLLPLFSVFIHKVTLAVVPFQIFFFQLHKKKSFFPKYHFCMHLSVFHGSSLAKFAFSPSFFTNYIFLFLLIFMY